MCPTAKKSETESNMAKVHLNAAYVQESQMARHMFIGEVCQKALYFPQSPHGKKHGTGPVKWPGPQFR